MRSGVLVTGATGTVGAEVAHELLRRGVSVVAGLHRRDAVTDSRRTELTGHQIARIDVALPSLGLDEAAEAELGSQLDVVVHCAAVTSFGKEDSVYRAVNVRGTEHVIEFCIRNCLRLVYVSTAYVHGPNASLGVERPVPTHAVFANGYEKSKALAESAVASARRRGLDATIVRPSIVVGRSSDGATAEFDDFYGLVRVLIEGRVSRIPAEYGALLDLVPIDYVSNVICAAASEDRDQPQIVQAIGRSPVSFRDMSDVLAEYPSFRVPTYVSPGVFRVDQLSSRQQRIYRKTVQPYSSYFTRECRFQDDQCRRIAPRSEVGGAELLRRILDYAYDHGYYAPVKGV